jgi:hypothetical protein
VVVICATTAEYGGYEWVVSEWGVFVGMGGAERGSVKWETCEYRESELLVSD